MTTPYTIKGTFIIEVNAEDDSEARSKAESRLKNVLMTYDLNTVNKATSAPAQWKEGMLVEYIRPSEWAWVRGTRGRIIQLDIHEERSNRAGHEYQVFWTSPVDKDGRVKESAPIWWTTPDNVRYIEEDEMQW